jgi:lactoylglutathione lyase
MTRSMGPPRRRSVAAGAPWQNCRVTTVAALVLSAAETEKTADFYRALGVPLVDERHDEGPVHQAGQLGDVHVAVYPQESPGRAPLQGAGGSVFFGFYVESLEVVVDVLARRGSPLLSDHEQMPWGCRVVAEDPDGRAVEINQTGHCPPESRSDRDE